MKSRIIGKKQLLTFSLVFALGLAIFVNWYYTNQFNDTTEPEVSQKHNLGEAQFVNSNSLNDSDAFYTEAKLNRTKAHDEATKHLNTIINNKDGDKDTIDLAKKQLIKISEQIKLETDIENLINAQLKTKSIVTYDVDNIEVIMPQKNIDNKTVTKVKDIILSKTSLSSDKILIVELK